MSQPLRILDEDKIDVDGVCAVLECSRRSVHRAFRNGLEFLRTGPQPGGRTISSRQAVERYLSVLNGIDLTGETSARRHQNGDNASLPKLIGS